MLRSSVKVGELDREITFIQAIVSQGISGEDKITEWEEIDNDSVDNAKKIEGGGSTFVQADRMTWSQQTTWIIRWRQDLTPRYLVVSFDKLRLVFDTQVYEILNVADFEEGRQRFMSITANLLDNVFFT